MIIYQAKIENASGTQSPDECDPSLGRPPASFVVSRDRDGKTRSRYGDLVWDLSPYQPRATNTKLNFAFWGDGESTPARLNLAEEMRWLTFILIYLRPGRAYKPAGLCQMIGTFRTLAAHAEKSGCTLRDLIQDTTAATRAIRPSATPNLSSLTKTLTILGSEVTGYVIDTRKGMPELKAVLAAYRDSIKQTLPIPTRIYSEILHRLSTNIDDVSAVADQFIALLRDYISTPLKDNLTRHLHDVSGLDPDESQEAHFAALVAKHDLTDFWERKGLTWAGTGLSSLLTNTMHMASLAVQAFTGMRGDEADNLPYYCLEEERRVGDNRVHYIVKGVVTKVKGGVRRVQWITSTRGRNAILLAQKLSGFIYEAVGDPPVKTPRSINDYHLFLRSSAIIGNIKKPRPIYVNFNASSSIGNIFDVTITEADIEELSIIDEQRNWAEDDIVVGAPWKLKRHQLRRSLALYAHASGLVSLPSLKRQLQHLTEEMALYYCNGSAFATNFIGQDNESKHAGEEWREAEPVSEALAYIANVLLADQDDLFGPHVIWNQLHRRGEDSTILVNREETMKAFKNGQLAYKETPIGGCTNTGTCDKLPLTTLHTECLTEKCKHMVGKISNVERLIKLKQVQVAKLIRIDPTSFETKVDAEELCVLQSTLTQAKAKKIKRNLT